MSTDNDNLRLNQYGGQTFPSDVSAAPASAELSSGRKSIPSGESLPADHHSQSESSFWLNGEVLACSCPDCGSPMSIRLWLMLADCWNCGTCIELTDEQQQVLQQLLKKNSNGQSKQAVAAPAENIAATTAQNSNTATTSLLTSINHPRQSALQSSDSLSADPSISPQSSSEKVATKAVGKAASLNEANAWLLDWLDDLPAWFISMVVHIILLLILSLWTIGDDSKPPRIVLAVAFDERNIEGTNKVIDLGQDDPIFSLPANYKNKNIQQVKMRAEKDAADLQLDIDDAADAKDVKIVKANLSSADPNERVFSGRDPRLRVQMVRREGGTLLTEAAVARGLRWLSKHQNSDGSWSANRFQSVSNCKCGNHASVSGKMVGTSLSLLPFLGAGQTPRAGKYKQVVASGLQWMLTVQDQETGDLREKSSANAGMYVHGQATIVLCEAYYLTGDEKLRIAAQKAVDFIVKAQCADGGWRYLPRDRRGGDTSVVGWQLMALRSAQAAKLTVPKKTFTLANSFLDLVERGKSTKKRRAIGVNNQRGLYGYRPGSAATPAMTAEALLCRMYLGWKKSDPGMSYSVRWMLEKHPPSSKTSDLYYWYYATQVMHHWGGDAWERWNIKIRDELVTTQELEGHKAGSWSFRHHHDTSGGRLYSTALAVCTLEVYYRHAPIFRRIKLD